MRKKIEVSLVVMIALLLVAAWVSIPAFATEDDCRSPHDQCGHQDGNQDQDQGQSQDQSQDQRTTVSIENGAAAASAVNEGNSLGVETNFNMSSNVAAQAPDVVLIPNNNTERCLRVWGLSFSNTNGGGGLGIPFRSKECDLEAAADDAFSQGNTDLGWMLKCKQKSMKKAFGGKNWKTSGEAACFSQAMEGTGQVTRIHTLEQQLTEVLTQRDHELRQYEASKQRITEMCDESKNRMMEACQK